MLLNKQRLLDELKNDNILTKYSFEDPILEKNIKPSSIDLTVNYIFLPADKDIRKSNKEALNEFRHEKYKLEPGEVVLIEVKERFKMPTNLAGIIFPPNSLSKSGLVMTNPGHIDPGFSGIITLCLVNMGKKAVSLNSDTVICRLLTFDLGDDSLGYYGSGKGVDVEQFNCIARDFASVNDRALDAVKAYFNKTLPIVAFFVSLFLAAAALFIPFLSSISEKHFLEDNVQKSVSTKMAEDIQPELERLRKDLKALQNDIDLLCQTSAQANCTNTGTP